MIKLELIVDTNILREKKIQKSIQRPACDNDLSVGRRRLDKSKLAQELIAVSK